MNKNIAIILFDITSPSGTERAVANLANLLTEYGNYKVSIVSINSHDEGKCYYELNPEIKIKHLGIEKANLFLRTFSYIKLIFSMRRFVKLNNIDITISTAHSHNCLSLFYGHNAKKIACEHSNFAACPIYSRIIRRLVYPLLDKVVVLTPSDAKHYYGIIKKDKLAIIPNSLSFTCDTPSLLSNKRIIAVGRLVKLKGYDMLVKIAKELKSSIPDWHIDIFGEGEEHGNLLSLMKEYDVSDFVTINPVTNDIKKELLNSSLLVLTSKREGLPMVLLEAKACGLPIVSFNCPEGPADVIENEKDGFIIVPNDIDGFANKVIELAKSPNKLKSFGTEAYSNAQKYHPQNIFLLWNSLIESL